MKIKISKICLQCCEIVEFPLNFSVDWHFQRSNRLLFQAELTEIVDVVFIHFNSTFLISSFPILFVPFVYILIAAAAGGPCNFLTFDGAVDAIFSPNSFCFDFGNFNKMRITSVLNRQHIGFAFKRYWEFSKNRKIRDTGVVSYLSAKGVKVTDPAEYVKQFDRKEYPK